MKKFILIPSILLVGSSLFAQHMGNAESKKMANAEYANANYANNGNPSPRILRPSTNMINIPINHHEDITLSVKGMTNVKIDHYIAIFAITQTGKSLEEVNQLIDSRINNILANLSKDKLETYVDVISFVPMYEYEVEKKVFSKRTYNEVPSGFEVKKNIHVKYSDPKLVHKIMAIMAAEEVYDLATVDCYSNNMEAIRKELQSKASILLKEKMKLYEGLLTDSFATREKTMADGFQVYYPVDLYSSYQAFNSSSIKGKKGTVVNADKETSYYYNPIEDKEFDFVVNPVSLETSIQVLYEVKLYIKRPKAPVKPQEPAKNRYFMMNPTTGQANEIFINNTDK